MACCNKKRPVLVGALILIVIAYFTSLLDTPSSSNQLDGIGTLEAKEVIAISPKHASSISAMYVNEGDYVTKGEHLAQMKRLKPAKTENTHSKAGDYFLRAPTDGIIFSREAEAGNSIDAQTPVFKIVNFKNIWIKAYINKNQNKGPEVGQNAVITLRSTGEKEHQGIVQRIDDVNDRIAQASIVYITFNTLPKSLRLGEQAEVKITPTND